MNKHRDFNRRAFWRWTLPVTLAFSGMLVWPYDAPTDYTSAAAQQAAQEQAAALRKEKAEIAINNEGKNK
jgi:hypothetical protein